MKNRILFFAVASIVFALDQGSKAAVVRGLRPGREIELIPGFARVIHVVNTGAVFGILSEMSGPLKETLLTAVAVAAVGIMAYYFIRYPRQRRLFHTGLAAVFGGAAGNIVDRVSRGFVVDFIDLHAGDHFTWPTFNLADTAICVGIALMLIDMYRKDRKEAADVS